MSVIPKHEPMKRKTKPQQPVEPPKPAKLRERTGTRADYGTYYWCVKTGISEDGLIYVFADDVHYLPTGGVLFTAMREDGHVETNLALSAGQWKAVFAASCWDGHAIAVEHWKGEIIR